MSRLTEPRQLIPGSTGWSVRDLDDPKIEAEWEAGHFQIIEGVLAIMPPAYWDNSSALQRLIRQVQRSLEDRDLPADFGCEVDVIVGEIRVPKADAVYLSEADKAKQIRAKNPRTSKRLKYGRLCVPPTLVIANISKGHESEDRIVKRGYYAEISDSNPPSPGRPSRRRSYSGATHLNVFAVSGNGFPSNFRSLFFPKNN